MRKQTFLKARAKRMRAEMTPHEKKIWRLLHEGELAGLNWRRQVALENYILDFVSHPAKLVIEIDGAQHAEEIQKQHDATRTAWLNAQGYRVLRIWNVEALQEQDGVWLTIHGAAKATPARARMQRWRHDQDKARLDAMNNLPLDGGGGREAAGGGARADGEGKASRGTAGESGGSHPLSHASRDSSPIEGERG